MSKGRRTGEQKTAGAPGPGPLLSLLRWLTTFTAAPGKVRWGY